MKPFHIALRTAGILPARRSESVTGSRLEAGGPAERLRSAGILPARRSETGTGGRLEAGGPAERLRTAGLWPALAAGCFPSGPAADLPPLGNGTGLPPGVLLLFAGAVLVALAADFLFFRLAGSRKKAIAFEAERKERETAEKARLDGVLAERAAECARLEQMLQAVHQALAEERQAGERLGTEVRALRDGGQALREELAEMKGVVPEKREGEEGLAALLSEWAEMERRVMDALDERSRTPRRRELQRHVRDEADRGAADCAEKLGRLASLLGPGEADKALAEAVREGQEIHRRMLDLRNMQELQRDVRGAGGTLAPLERIGRARDAQNLLLISLNEQILLEMLNFPLQWVSSRFLKSADAYLRGLANDPARPEVGDSPAAEAVKAVLALAEIEPVIPLPGTLFDPRQHIGRAAECDPRYNDGVVLGVVACGFRSTATGALITTPEVVVNRLGAAPGGSFA